MTKEEFLRTRFAKGMRVKYRESIYDVVSVDFEECLIGMDAGTQECGCCGEETVAVSWVRCENCDLITKTEWEHTD